jgi:hypothetical protein
MKIIAFDSARLTVLFPLEEVSPLDGAGSIDIIDQVAMRYKFAKRPDLTLPKEELQKVGLKFEHGLYVHSDREANITSFTIFTDGVVIDAPTTDDAELFWVDICQWLLADRKFRDFVTAPRRRFVSQVIVEFDRPLSDLIRQFGLITQTLSDKLSEIYNTRVPMGLARIDLEFDHLGENSALVIPRFVIERRKNIAFSRERYFCIAPLRTNDHLHVLGEIEKTIN